MMTVSHLELEFTDAPSETRRGLPWISKRPVLMAAANVLVLEDSLIIALETEDILRAKGVEAIDIVNTHDQAMDAIRTKHYDFALLDVNLGNAMSFDFARHLVAQGVPFGFVSGYSDSQDFPEDLRNVPLLVKPFDEDTMHIFLNEIALQQAP